MGRLVFVNGSPKKDGYWANELRGNVLLLLTHRLAALELAVAWRQQDSIFWYPAGTQMGFRGPLTLAGWEPRAEFFTLHLSGAEGVAKPTSSRKQTDDVLAGLKAGDHLVIWGPKGVSRVIMGYEAPAPSTTEVEEALRAAGVPRAQP